MKTIMERVLQCPDIVDRALQELHPHERLFVEQWNGDLQDTWERIRKECEVKSHKLSYGAVKKMASDIRVVRAIRIYNAHSNPGIASKNERQEFWSSVMLDETERMSDRLKASELLGKAAKDFVEQVEISATTDFAKALADARKRTKEIDVEAEVIEAEPKEDPFR